MVSVGGGAALLGGDAEARGRRLRGEGREFVDAVGLFQQFGRVAVKADGVAAAGTAVELGYSDRALFPLLISGSVRLAPGKRWADPSGVKVKPSVNRVPPCRKAQRTGSA